MRPVDPLSHYEAIRHDFHFATLAQLLQLDAHVATAHARAYRDALQPLTGSPLDERVYTAISAEN